MKIGVTGSAWKLGLDFAGGQKGIPTACAKGLGTLLAASAFAMFIFALVIFGTSTKGAGVQLRKFCFVLKIYR